MYDIVFLGGGLNYAGAVVAAKKGLKVALIEQDLEHIGGTCLNNGCIPSKHLLHFAKIETELRHPAFSRHKDRIKFDVVVKEKEELLKKAHHSIQIQCESAGVELVEGYGVIEEPHKVEVNGKVYEGKHIVIGTGSHPFIPNGIEYDKEAIITSDEVLNLKTLPSSIAIYGSGAIGLEMACFFAAMGVETTLIFRHEHIGKNYHPQILTALEKLLQGLGIKFMPNTTILEVKPHNKRAKVVTNHDIYEFDKLLVATGRHPNVDAIKTDAIKIEKGILTDEWFETTLPKHYAIGDCNAKVMLAHAARAQVFNVVDQILGKRRKLDLNLIPRFIYTLPLQYSSIGTKGAKSSIFPLSSLALSHFSSAKDGMVVVYADEENFITGAEILAPDAQELISIFSVTLGAELDRDTLLDSVYPHPTFSEAIERALRRL